MIENLKEVDSKLKLEILIDALPKKTVSVVQGKSSGRKVNERKGLIYFLSVYQSIFKFKLQGDF